MGFPLWVIGIVIIVLIIALSTSVYFVFRKKIGKKRTAVGARNDEETILEKSVVVNNPSFSSAVYPPAITPLYNIASSQNSSNLSSKHGLKNNHSSSTIPTTVPSSPYTTPSTKLIEEEKSLSSLAAKEANYPIPQHSSSTIKDDNMSFEEEEEMDDSSASYQPKSSFTIEIPKKINLPLPPPSSSFFADKMELDSTEAHDLYQAYLSASQEDPEEVSKLSLSNIQQKAANIRSSIYQSLRRKSTYGSNKSPPIGQFLDAMKNNSSSNSIKSPTSTKSPPSLESRRVSRQSSSASFRVPPRHPFLPPSPNPDSPAASSSESNHKKLLHQEEEPTSNKIMIDTLNQESYFSLPMTPVTPSPIGMKSKSLAIHQATSELTDYCSTVIDDINQFNTISLEDDSDEEHKKESEEEDMDSAQKAASAARKLIRSASRKSKTLSMIVTDEDAQAMFTSLQLEEKMPSTPDQIAKYATVRGRNNKKPPVNIDTFNTVRAKSVEQTMSDGTLSGKQSIRIRNQLNNAFGMEEGRSKKETTLKNLFSKPKDEDASLVLSSQQDTGVSEDILNKATSSPTESSPYSSKNNTLQKASSNVDTIRKMLQSSWSGNNIKESLSNSSLNSNRSSACYMGSIGSSGFQQSPVGSVNPRLQNQRLVSSSLRNNSQLAARSRPSMPSDFMEGPTPTVSFSTSTVQTMIPAEEEDRKQPKKSLGNLMKKQQKVRGKTPAQIEREKYLKSIDTQ